MCRVGGSRSSPAVPPAAVRGRSGPARPGRGGAAMWRGRGGPGVGRAGPRATGWGPSLRRVGGSPAWGSSGAAMGLARAPGARVPAPLPAVTGSPCPRRHGMAAFLRGWRAGSPDLCSAGTGSGWPVAATESRSPCRRQDGERAELSAEPAQPPVPRHPRPEDQPKLRCEGSGWKTVSPSPRRPRCHHELVAVSPTPILATSASGSNPRPMLVTGGTCCLQAGWLSQGCHRAGRCDSVWRGVHWGKWDWSLWHLPASGVPL